MPEFIDSLLHQQAALTQKETINEVDDIICDIALQNDWPEDDIMEIRRCLGKLNS